jgi:hypothetical protein
MHAPYSEIKPFVKYSTIEDCISNFVEWNKLSSIRTVVVYEPFMFSVWNKFKSSLPELQKVCRKAVKQILFVSIINDLVVVDNLRSINPTVEVGMLCCMKNRHFLLEGIIDGQQNPVTPEQMKIVLSQVRAQEWITRMEKLQSGEAGLIRFPSIENDAD